MFFRKIDVIFVKYNFAVMILVVVLYFMNQLVFKPTSEGFLHWFLVCYFNDIIAGMMAISSFNILLSVLNIRMLSLKKILAVVLVAAVIWEFPCQFRSDAVSDIWDVVAYECGGILYYLIFMQIGRKENYGNKDR